MRDWHAAGVKREATIARLDVLEAAVLAPSEALPRPERVPAAHHLADPGGACYRSPSGADAGRSAGSAVALTARFLRRCLDGKMNGGALLRACRQRTLRACEAGRRDREEVRVCEAVSQRASRWRTPRHSYGVVGNLGYRSRAPDCPETHLG